MQEQVTVGYYVTVSLIPIEISLSALWWNVMIASNVSSAGKKKKKKDAASTWCFKPLGWNGILKAKWHTASYQRKQISTFITATKYKSRFIACPDVQRMNAWQVSLFSDTALPVKSHMIHSLLALFTDAGWSLAGVSSRRINEITWKRTPLLHWSERNVDTRFSRKNGEHFSCIEGPWIYMNLLPKITV